MRAKDSPDKQLLSEALDRINEISNVFRDKSDAQKLKENAEHEKHLQKFKSRKANNSIHCMIEGCDHPAIQSHSISKQCYLENIATEGHLVRFEPRDNKLERKLVLRTIGINDATVFKGYCSQHDNTIYEEIDNGPINSIKGLFLQCLRVIDYSLYWEQFGYRYMQAVIQKLRNELGKDISSLFYSGKYDNTFEICKIRNIIKHEIQNNRFQGFGWHLHIHTYDNYEVHFERSDLKFPVAMYNYFTLNTGHLVYVIVLPAKDYTDLIMLCNKELNLGVRWQYIVRDPISLLNFVEGCMIMGENWVASPSIFDHMSEEKKQVIATDLTYYKCQMLCDENDYDVSILDDLRKTIVNDLPDNDSRKAIEKLKLCKIPVRDIGSMKQQFLSKVSELYRLTDWDKQEI